MLSSFSSTLVTGHSSLLQDQGPRQCRQLVLLQPPGPGPRGLRRRRRQRQGASPHHSWSCRPINSPKYPPPTLPTHTHTPHTTTYKTFPHHSRCLPPPLLVVPYNFAKVSPTYTPPHTIHYGTPTSNIAVLRQGAVLPHPSKVPPVHFAQVFFMRPYEFLIHLPLEMGGGCRMGCLGSQTLTVPQPSVSGCRKKGVGLALMVPLVGCPGLCPKAFSRQGAVLPHPPRYRPFISPKYFYKTLPYER